MILNQISYLILVIIMLLAALIVLRWGFRSSTKRLGIAQAGLVLLAIIGFLLLRPGSSDIQFASDAQRIINNNRPTMVEFFSNYCLGCMSYRPEIDRIIEQFQGELDVLRIDIHTTLGRDLRDELGFSFTPEFILFNERGQEIWRGHIPPTQTQLDGVTS